MIEVLVAFTVLTILSAGAIAGIIGVMGGANDADIRVTAANVAQQDLQQQRAVADRTQIVGSPVVNGNAVAETRTVGNRTFSLLRAVSGTCGTSHAKGYSPIYIDVTDTVSWAGDTHPVIAGTRLAC